MAINTINIADFENSWSDFRKKMHHFGPVGFKLVLWALKSYLKIKFIHINNRLTKYPQSTAYPFLNLMSILPLSSFINSKYLLLLVEPEFIIFAEII